MKKQEENVMKRGDFLRSLSLGTSTLMAFYCMGTLTSCGSSDDPTPDPGTGGGNGITGTTTGSAINFTIDLSNSSNSSLKTPGGSKIIGDVLVAFSTTSVYAALAKACTHQGTDVGFVSSSNMLLCPNHGSEFSLTGAVIKGPNTGETITALKAYTTTLSADGKTLTVKA